MPDLVTIKIENHVADVRLNRADKYNALSPEMFDAIIDAGKAVARDKSVRAVVLSGEGRGFCAGLDFQSFAAMGEGQKKGADLFQRTADQIANHAQMPGMVWKQCPVPVIAAIHGVAFGGGLQIALGADIRLAAPNATFSVMEMKWGLVPDMSLTQTVRDLVRIDVAKELTFTGRVVEADEAAKIGLVTRVCDNPLEEALRLAGEVASKSPHAVSAAKHLLNEAWHSGAEEGLRLEESLQRDLIGSPNQVEAVMANFEKRPPKYADRD